MYFDNAQTLMLTTSGSFLSENLHKRLFRMPIRKGACVCGYTLSCPTKTKLIAGHCCADHFFTTSEKNGANALIVRSGESPSRFPAPSIKHVIPGQEGHLSLPKG